MGEDGRQNLKNSFMDSIEELRSLEHHHGISLFDVMVQNIEKRLETKDEEPIFIILPRYPGTKDKSMTFRSYYRRSPVKFLSDDLILISSGVSAPANHPEYILFRDNIQRLFEAGLTNELSGTKYGKSDHFQMMFQIYDKQMNLAPLNLKMLEAGFVIWLVSVGISMLAFLYEMMICGYQRLVKK